MASVARGPYIWTYNGSDSDTYAGLNTAEIVFSGAKKVVKYKSKRDLYDHGSSLSGGCPRDIVGTEIFSYEDELNRTTDYGYNDDWNIEVVRLPERNGYRYEYDSRGNIEFVTRLSKPESEGDTADTIIFKAEYPPDCDNPKKCNQPNKVWDANGAQSGHYTEYEYEDHGGVKRVIQPEVNGVHPVTRYKYTPHDTGDGTIYRQTSSSLCIRGSDCEDTANEVKTVTTYWGHTFLPKTHTVMSGDGLVQASQSFDYNSAGRVVVATDELLQKTYFFYDAAGRKTGEIGPDPDGSGPLLRLATRTAYNDDDQVTKVETGTVSGPLEADLGAMSVTNTLESEYDGMGRKVVDRRSSGGSTLVLTQYSYDQQDRPVCTAVRMNDLDRPSLSLPDACVAGSGAEGDDRVTMNVYDRAGQLRAVSKAVGTLSEQVDGEYDYTDNGKLRFIVDAEANLTESHYDGFDRLIELHFPSKTKGSRAASGGDYETYKYDANDNRTEYERRDGTTLIYGYNELNWLTSKIVPEWSGLSPAHTRDVYYTHDLRGLVERTAFDSFSGPGMAQQFDALGHQSFSTIDLDGVSRTLGYSYNAKVRTRVTHPDGQAFTYNHDNINRLIGVSHPVAGALAEFTYDPQGRLDTQGGGIATSYDFDGIGRLQGLAHDLAGVVYDNASIYGYNPASQVTQVTNSNISFAPVVAPRNETYEVNGLNQYTDVSGVQYNHDANGNLTFDGKNTYTYDQENRLVKATSNGEVEAELWYDPLGRLNKVQSPSGTTQFLYDGDELVAEYSGTGNTVAQRYIHGISVDDPVAWFPGSSVTAGNRRHLRANHQGSIVAVADAAGSKLHAPRYDAWGRPQGNHPIRFGYTGQAWIPELGLWHYKARMYSPGLGRFLQTDPVGYEDQLNLYAYVGNDPLNGVDPTGEWFETAWDLLNVAMGAKSLASNIEAGNVGEAALDAGGLIIDVVATVVPGIPGGAGTLLKGRKAATAVDKAADAARGGASLPKRNHTVKHNNRKAAKEAAQHAHGGKPKPTPKQNASKQKKQSYKESQKSSKPESHPDSEYPEPHFHDSNKSKASSNVHHTW